VPITSPPVSSIEWVTPDAVAPDARVTQLQLPDGLTWDIICTFASTILYRLSGCQYGLRTDTIRPHRPIYGGSGAWGSSWLAGIGGWGLGSPGWFSSGFPESWLALSREYVLPSKGPVVPATITVQVDGVTLVPQGQAGAQWQLVSGRRLVRTIDPVSGGWLPWPLWQLIERPLGQPGTWAITYTHGKTVPPDGQLAAYELAVELGLFYGQRATKIPQRATRVQRQGVSIDLASDMRFMDSGKTGLWACDMWLEAVNPYRLRRRSSVNSVDKMRADRL
jgi:hypothetical protein